MSSKDIVLKDIFEEVPFRFSKLLSPAPIDEGIFFESLDIDRAKT